MTRALLFLAVVLVAFCPESPAQVRSSLVVPGPYDPAIPTPDSALGFPLGSRPARYEEVRAYCTLLAERSPRVRLAPLGATHEGRRLFLLTIATEEHHAAMETIRATIARLGDPRVMTSGEIDKISRTTPAIVWIGYGIHGDELSSVDAALQVAYELAAGESPETDTLLRELIICIDPVQNPDGRERFLAQVQQYSGAVPNSDLQSMNHTGIWPAGRGNHYLFDMNRDWFLLVHPESRARIGALIKWNPQVLIDSHEMGAYDTYLFSPATEPLNPNLPPISINWWSVFARDQAAAFDRFGWSYYTREWNDEWYPGYGSAWTMYTGVVGILYEQAGVDGSLVKRPDGTVMSYAQTVEHHVVSSMANLTTAAARREELLRDFARTRDLLAHPAPGAPEAFVLPLGVHPGRTQRLVRLLLDQGIEVKIAEHAFTLSGARGWRDAGSTKTQCAPGTYVVPLRQPLGRLAKTILEFDPRMKSSFLKEERAELERRSDSKIYDVTAWSLPMMFNVEAFEVNRVPSVDLRSVTDLAPSAGSVVGGASAYGYLVEYGEDPAPRALAQLLEQGLKVRAAQQPFSMDGHSYGRGTLLLRANENPESLRDLLERVSSQTGVTMRAVPTALATQGPDLGGNDFVLLREPRIAILGGPDVSSTGFGSLWHMLDKQLGMRVTLLNSSMRSGFDLRKYSVLVLPDGSSERYERVFGKSGIAGLKEWVEQGGTLIGLSGGATFLADSSAHLCRTRLRRQSLGDLALFERALALERGARNIGIDSIALWNGTSSAGESKKTPAAEISEKEQTVLDERGRLFMPRGALLRVMLDPEHWLAFGEGTEMAALVYSSHAFLSRDPVETPARFSTAGMLRLSGLLWPEARERWAGSAYATRERLGNGQIVLFAEDPTFRAASPASERLLANALLLGPGFGTRAPVEW
jgi:hypothetical protein